MSFLCPNEQRAKVAITLIWVVLTIEIVSPGSSALQFRLLQDIANGGEVATETANESSERFLGLLPLVTFAISGITFIPTFIRANFNLQNLVSSQSHKAV